MKNYPVGGSAGWKDERFIWPRGEKVMSKAVFVPIKAKYFYYRLPVGYWEILASGTVVKIDGYPMVDLRIPQILVKHVPGREYEKFGGMSVAVIKYDTEIRVGVTVCSVGDEFSKTQGRRIARNRAIDALMVYDVPIVMPKVTSKVVDNIAFGLLEFYTGLAANQAI